MRVLHVITGLFTGGAEGQLTRLVGRRSVESERVVSLVGGGANAAALRESGHDVVELDAVRGRPGIGPVLGVAREIDSFRPDYVLSWLYHANLYALSALALIGRRPRQHLIWNIRGSAMKLENHGRSIRAASRLGAWLSARPAAIVVNSETGQRDHAAIGYHPRRWAVIHNGVDTDEFAPDPDDRARMRAALGLRSGEFVVLFAGRADPQKDFATLLAAIELVPGVRILCAGRGTETLPDHPALIRLGQRLDMPSIYRAADLLVSSSAYGEGFANVVAEAMASGVPVVATSVGDIHAIVGQHGFVVPPRDPRALAAAIRAGLGLDQAERATLAELARQRIRERFSFDRSVGAYRDLYASLATAGAEKPLLSGRIG
ncbi:MAG: glycosyltransferase [Bauldia sp.]|jgi:glycosyltransferase involved in cell wall biosynthesis